MKYIDFYGHKVSKLIVGDNPFNGHSYITAYIPEKEMVEYYTEDKILEAIQAIEETHYIRKIIDIQIDHEPYYLSLYKEGRSIYYEIEKKTTNSMTHLALNDLSSLLSAPSEQLWQNLSNNICKILGLHKTIIFKNNIVI